MLLIMTAQESIGQAHATLNVATYNLRYLNVNDGENIWPNRKDHVKGLIRFHEFDIVGTQEAVFEQINDILDLEEFAFTGVGRDDGEQAGEHSAILYRKDRLELLQSGDFWFSETPEIPSLGWDAQCCNRISSWAKFRDRTSKQEFYVFNAHFDHQGVIARRESAKLLKERINEIAGDAPVFAMGDFNALPQSEPIQTMVSFLDDAYHKSVTPPYGPVGTSNGFRLTSSLERRIDYIFMSDQIEVLKYGVLTDFNEQRFPSDHLPVMIKAIVN